MPWSFWHEDALLSEKIKIRVIIFAAFGALLSFTSSGTGETLGAISPSTYQALTCPQIVQEGRSVSRKGFTLSGLQPGTGGTDNTETKSAVILVWLASPNAPAKKLSDLRYADSQMDALEQASIASQCSIFFRRPAKS
jgi:hypothetical protein